MSERDAERFPSVLQFLHTRCGSSSAVERELPKLDVAGSIPVSRSNLLGCTADLQGPRAVHLTETPDFDPVEPTINVNIRPRQDEIEMEWDVVGCQSFKQETGKWASLRPGELVPT